MTATTLCGHCNHSFNSRMKHCPFCGAQRKSTVPESSRLLCPICTCDLTSGSYRAEPVGICSSCNGMWLTTRQCELLTSERHAMADESVPFEYRKPPIEQRTHYIPCPACRKPMVREHFRAMSGIIIDRCGDHGTWFDAGELCLIRAFIANGGITRSQDKQIQANRENIELLRFRVNELELMEKILHKWRLKRIRFRKL